MAYRNSLRPTNYSTIPRCRPNIGVFSTPEELQQQWEDCRDGIVPADPAIGLQIPSVHDPELAPEGKHAASAFALWFPIEGDGLKRTGPTAPENRNGTTRDRQDDQARPEFRAAHHKHTTFTPRHMGTMFGAPGGDYCYGLLHPDQIGTNRPGPTGFVGPADRRRRALPGKRRMLRRARHHVHPRLQRGSPGARGREERKSLSGREERKSLSGREERKSLSGREERKS